MMMIGALTISCAVQEPSAPPLSGPSELGLSLQLTASPDVLPRDGVTTSSIRITARDAQGQGISGQRILLSTSAGTLSASEVVTGSSGDAAFVLNPLPMNQELSQVVVSATAVTADAVNAATRTVNITVVGSAPSATFSVNPASPKRLQMTTLSATAFVNGTICGTECTYSWRIDDASGEANLSGRTVLYRFQVARAYVVYLIVTAPNGATSATSKVVTVQPPALPIAAITFSPTDPAPGQNIFFDGLTSAADPDGDTQIVRYLWDFGDGTSTVEGATVPHQYAAEQTYTVRLTVFDNLGRSATATKEVSVKVP
jgi:PKD repeat protein